MLTENVDSNKDDTETEIQFRFQVPRLPDAASETRFRLELDFITHILLMDCVKGTFYAGGCLIEFQNSHVFKGALIIILLACPWA